MTYLVLGVRERRDESSRSGVDVNGDAVAGLGLVLVHFIVVLVKYILWFGGAKITYGGEPFLRHLRMHLCKCFRESNDRDREKVTGRRYECTYHHDTNRVLIDVLHRPLGGHDMVGLLIDRDKTALRTTG